MPREEDAMRGKDAHMQATKREESSNIPVLPSKRIRDAALSTFIHHYTFAAKSKSIKYDSRRTI